MTAFPHPTRRHALTALGAFALAPWPLAGRAQAFPGKPIRVLIGVPAGGTQDVLTRAIADQVRGSLGTVIIDNRGGAAGRIAVDVVKNAEPDGHTLLLGTAGMMTMFPNAYKSLNYDPVKDFIPIINAASFELAMVVNKDLPASNLAEFVAWAKTQGNKISFASYGAGTPSHFLGEMLNRAAGLQMVHIPYKGSTPARQDVMSGTVPVYFDTVGGAITMLPSGRIKVLATSGEKRSPPMPAIPTFVELGYREVIASAWFSYYAPARTPKPVGDGPDALLKTMRDDTARRGRVMRAVNFQAND